MQIISTPRVTLVSRPLFYNPPHLPFQPSNESGAQDLAEFGGRLCYMSFGTGEIDGHKTVTGRANVREYFANIRKQKHGSVLEHANFSLLVEGVSRSLTHELVRHRAGFAYSQLSQRFVEASNVAFVLPPSIPFDDNDATYRTWVSSCREAKLAYGLLLDQLERTKGDAAKKKIREAARSVLPNCVETKILVTANVRAWRHFFTKRGALGADAEIRRLAIAAYYILKAEAPFLFEDVMLTTNEQRESHLTVEFENV